jgi:hypothetical protein
MFTPGYVAVNTRFERPYLRPSILSDETPIATYGSGNSQTLCKKCSQMQTYFVI